MTHRRPRALFLAALIAWILGIGKCVDPSPRSPTSSKAILQVHSLANALSVFRLDVGRYPSTAEGLQALVLNPGVANWAGPYLSRGLQDDPWGKAYHYRAIGKHGFQLSSWGADGKEGGTGEAADIRTESP